MQNETLLLYVYEKHYTKTPHNQNINIKLYGKYFLTQNICTQKEMKIL